MKTHNDTAGFPRALCLVLAALLFPCAGPAGEGQELISTFSIVGRDSVAGEMGIGVASRFFAVGSVVPWAKAGVGAVATQSFSNVSFGWRGLELLERGVSPQEAATILLRGDDDPSRRQFGIVSWSGVSATYTGPQCIPWAGGRSGPGYAIQGNILAGEAVVAAMESAYVRTVGTLAERLYAALVAGDRMGGDSRGRQSAALLVVKKNAGYGGYTDRAIDIRVDDHPEPFAELGRLLEYALMNSAWNEGWTLFTQRRPADALPHIQRAVHYAPGNPELLYDLAVVTLAAGNVEEALRALKRAVTLNPKLKAQAQGDADLERVRGDKRFEELVK